MRGTLAVTLLGRRVKVSVEVWEDSLDGGKINRIGLFIHRDGG